MESPVVAVAESIVGYILKEDGDGLDRNLNMSDSEWKQELRYEFDLEKTMETIFRNDIFIPKLIVSGIQTISPFHYAALRGVDFILEKFILQHQIPVDMCVKSGSTALHFACFAGDLDTVVLLVERFHADVNRKDRYGWTALHYASTEGNLLVISYLVRWGADISARDKDGTTAAFRAQTFGHADVVSFFVQSSGDDDLLLVEETEPEPEDDGEIYAFIDPFRKSETSNDDDDGFRDDETYYETAVVTSRDEDLVDESTARGTTDVAILVRDQLTEIFGGNSDPYTNPISRRAGGTVGGRTCLDIGVKTLTRILKDEFLKFKADHEIIQASDSKPDMTTNSGITQSFTSPSEYEDISSYRQETVGCHDFNLDQCATKDDDDVTVTKVDLPPLPPRGSPVIELKGETLKGNSKTKSQNKNAKKKKKLNHVNYTTLTFDEVSQQYPTKTKALLILDRFDHSSTVMESCFQALVQNLDDVEETWKRLSAALPLRNRPEAVEKRIQSIEMQHPADPTRQALGALQDWRNYFGEEANVDALVAAMKRCGLEDKVSIVEAAAEDEFSV